MICLTNTEPERYGRVQLTGETSQLRAFQTKIRSSDPQVAWTKTNQLQVAYDQKILHRQTVIQPNSQSAGGTYNVGAITIKSGPLFLGREGSATKRSLYTINAIVDIIQLA